ncbi:MAG TPA: hypothetical protein VEK07_08180 [Polyangiaceae bacterium]|nr:hypothetical protein [Polyangiaceae bacterium]
MGLLQTSNNQAADRANAARAGRRKLFAAFAVGIAMVVEACHGGSSAPPRQDAHSMTATQSASSWSGGFENARASLMETKDAIREAAALMLDFAERTGLSTEGPGRRYLWTDAFAVCNYLGLARATGEGRYSDLALRLIDRVHGTLGKHRPDDRRAGWISGLDGEEARAHPTRGGLRIGKDLPERQAGEPFDEQLEWDRDGQYFHYLTKWMLALDQAARATRDSTFNAWGRELAETAHRAFAHAVDGGERRLYWKMSIDLTRPLVTSMGQHDAVDGYVTSEQLRATALALPGAAFGPPLDDVAADFDSMINRGNVETTDPLGLGGLLADAYRAVQLGAQSELKDTGLPQVLLDAALAGLERYSAEGELERPAEARLAFRELGLAIGLHAASLMRQGTATDGGPPLALRDVLEKLRRYDRLRTAILAFWRAPEHRRASSWIEHRDINDVMLATALAPEGFLVLRISPQTTP